MIALGILAAVLLLLINGFFVAAEFASVSVRRAQLEARAGAGRRGQRVLAAQRRLSLLLAGAQLGITLCSLGLGAVAEPSVARLLEHGFEHVHLPGALAHPVAFAVALAVVVLLHMVIGEMVPKNIALSRPESAALALVPTLGRFVSVTRPVIVAFNASANALLRLAGVQPQDELKSAYTADELAVILAQSRAEGLLGADEHRRLATTLALHEVTVGDVAVRLDPAATVTPDADLEQVQAVAARTGQVRVPVRAGSGRPVGYVHLHDTLDRTGSVADAVRPMPELAPGTRLPDAMGQMQRSGTQLATVGDRVLTLTAVLAELVG